MMRIVGVIVIVFAVVEFGLGASADSFLNNSPYFGGCWWTGILSFLTGIFGLVIKSKTGGMIMGVLGTAATLAALVGMLLDSVSSNRISRLTACGQIDELGDVFVTGATNDASTSYIMDQCDFQSTSSCYCVSTAFSGCNPYDVISKYNCNDLQTLLPKLLKSSVAFCCAIALCSFILAVSGYTIACSSVASNDDKEMSTDLQKPTNVAVGMDFADKLI